MYACRCRPLQRSQILKSCTVTSRTFVKGGQGCIQGQAGRRRCKGGLGLSRVLHVEWARLYVLDERVGSRASKLWRQKKLPRCKLPQMRRSLYVYNLLSEGSEPAGLLQCRMPPLVCFARATAVPAKESSREGQLDGCVDGDGNSSSLFVPVASRP